MWMKKSKGVDSRATTGESAGHESWQAKVQEQKKRGEVRSEQTIPEI